MTTAMVEEKLYDNATSAEAAAAASGLTQVLEPIGLRMPLRKKRLQQQASALPKPSVERLQSSQNDQPFNAEELSKLVTQDQKEDTVLYLGYGSNLAAETFLGKRGIRPLSQMNVVAPSISLTFDLPGIPYSEPCFANTRYREDPSYPPPKGRPPYHKNAWKKGLVGVVYEVTKKDYAHIIATEGGGAGYHDVLVDCYTLDDDPNVEVPVEPTGTSFKAHTLYAHSSQALRPDPDYAQPSARYLKLITDGANEHDLPKEYRFFLKNIRTYHVTSTKQQLGGYVFLSVWGVFFMFFFVGGKIFLKKDGTCPAWFAKFAQALFTACWASYDEFFFKTFGEGERTVGDKLDDEEELAANVSSSEKTPLLGEQLARIGSQP